MRFVVFVNETKMREKRKGKKEKEKLLSKFIGHFGTTMLTQIESPK